MDINGTGVRFQSSYELLLESGDRKRTRSGIGMSLRGRREKVVKPEQTGEQARHGDYESRLKNCCE